VFLEIECLTRHDGFWTVGVRDSPFRREEIELFDGIQHNINRQKLGDPVEWKTMTGGSASLFNHSDAVFDIRDVRWRSQD
jgi:hypothetical protein